MKTKPTKLRLLVTTECDRNCPGCCNNQFDILNLPSPDHFNYEMVMITGGEPMMEPLTVIDTVCKIRQTSSAKIILYTADTRQPKLLMSILALCDGITLTLHDQNDFIPFLVFNSLVYFYPHAFENKSLRLNVFKEVKISDQNFGLISQQWEVKKDIVWLDPCSLPDGEILMKLKNEYSSIISRLQHSISG